MPPWKPEDSAAGVPKFLSSNNEVNSYFGNEVDDAFFVDATEAQVESNRAKGFTTPGWYLYRTYTTTNGNTRHKAELLVEMGSVTAAVAGDDGVAGNTAIEDATVADS